MEADRHQVIGHLRADRRAMVVVNVGYQILQLPFVQQVLHWPGLGRENVCEEHPSSRSLEERPLGAFFRNRDLALVRPHQDFLMQVNQACLECGAHLVAVREHPGLLPFRYRRQRQVVAPQDHVLGRADHRRAVRRRKQVAAAHHQLPRLFLGSHRQRYVHRHLVAVEVGIVREAHQRMNLDSAALHQADVERLDAQPVQRRSTVQQDRVIARHFLQDVPDFRIGALHHSLSALDIAGQLVVHQPAHDERLEELQRHPRRQATFVQLEVGTHHDDGPSRVVDPLAQQVLAKSPLLPAQQVAQRFVGVRARSCNRAPAPSVVDQCVNRLLQHPLLVADDDFRSSELDQSLQSVVAVDHPTIEVVQVARCKPATVQLDHRSQVRRQHREHRDDHPIRLIPGPPERFHHSQSLCSLAALLDRVRPEIGAQLDRQFVKVGLAD